MKIRTTKTRRGFCLEVSGAWTAAPLEMRFPERIWQAFPAKDALIRELAYLFTLAPPVILDHPTVWYRTPAPRFFDLYNQSFEDAIPNLVEHVPDEDPETVLARFRAVGRHFEGPAEPLRLPAADGWHPRSAVVPFSFGKDSLLTLATLRELGYRVHPVIIDERVLPRGLALRRKLLPDFETVHDLSCLWVESEPQLLSDWQVLRRPRTELNRVHVHFVYLLAMMPFCFYFQAPPIAFSNEHLYSLMTRHRQGYLQLRGVMQSRPMVRKMAGLLRDFSGGQLALVNPIGPLGNFSIHRLLHGVFPEFGGFRVSCHLEMSRHRRWCHNCYRCAQAYLFFKAMGRDPAAAGFEASMLEEDKARHFVLFHRPVHPKDASRRFVAREEALAFAMAVRRGVRAPLVDRYTEVFGPVSPRREKKMAEGIFRLQKRAGRHRIEKEAAALYRRWFRVMAEGRPLPGEGCDSG